MYPLIFSLFHYFSGECCLISCICEFLSFPPVIDLWTQCYEIRKDTWYDFNLLELPKTHLWSNMCSILENAPCVLEKNMDCGDEIEYLYTSVRFIWSAVLFKSTVFKCTVSLLTLWMMSVVESGVLKSPTLRA